MCMHFLFLAHGWNETNEAGYVKVNELTVSRFGSSSHSHTVRGILFVIFALYPFGFLTSHAIGIFCFLVFSSRQSTLKSQIGPDVEKFMLFARIQSN